jgi:hypothetical protein
MLLYIQPTTSMSRKLKFGNGTQTTTILWEATTLEGK